MHIKTGILQFTLLEQNHEMELAHMLKQKSNGGTIANVRGSCDHCSLFHKLHVSIYIYNIHT